MKKLSPEEQALNIFEAFNLLSETKITKLDQFVFSNYMVDKMIEMAEKYDKDNINTINHIYTFNTMTYWIQVKDELRQFKITS